MPKPSFTKPSSPPAESNSPDPISQRSSVETTGTLTSTKLAYLLCCIPQGKYGTFLYQERLEKINSDRSLFEFLQNFYHQHHYKWYSSYPLRNIQGLKLVRVCCPHLRLP